MNLLTRLREWWALHMSSLPEEDETDEKEEIERALERLQERFRAVEHRASWRRQ